MIKSLIRNLLCINYVPREPKLKIQLDMINSNVIRVNIKSLRDFLNTEEGKRKSGHYSKTNYKVKGE